MLEKLALGSPSRGSSASSRPTSRGTSASFLSVPSSSARAFWYSRRLSRRSGRGVARAGAPQLSVGTTSGNVPADVNAGVGAVAVGGAGEREHEAASTSAQANPEGRTLMTGSGEQLGFGN